MEKRGKTKEKEEENGEGGERKKMEKKGKIIIAVLIEDWLNAWKSQRRKREYVGSLTGKF